MSVDVYATVCMDWLYSFWISKMEDFENYLLYVIVELVEVWLEVLLFWFGGITGFSCELLFVMLLLFEFWFVWLVFVVVFVLFWAGTVVVFDGAVEFVVEFVVVPFAMTVWLAEHVKLTAFNTDQDWHSTHLLLCCMQVLQFTSVHIACKKQVLFKRM